VLVEDPEEFVRQTMVLPLKDSETGIRMDLIFSFSPYERQAMERVKLLKMGKAEVRFAAVEDVIILKMVAGRVILRTYARFSPRTLTLGSGISGIGLPRLIVI
jgi:hypothetical protein